MIYQENEHLEYKDYYIIFPEKSSKKYRKVYKSRYEYLKKKYEKATKIYGKEKSKKKITWNKWKRNNNYPFKKPIRPLKKVDPELKKEIGAFLNNRMQNGIHTSYIYIGIPDLDNEKISQKSFKGFPEESEICKKTYNDLFYRKIQTQITNQLKKDFIPPANRYVHILQNKPYTPICIRITSPKDIIFKAHIPQKGWTICIRSGSESKPASLHDIYELIKRTVISKLEKNDLTFDCKPCLKQNLSFAKLKNKCAQLGIKNFHTFKQDYEITLSKHKYSNAALLFCDNSKIKTRLFNSNLEQEAYLNGPITDLISFDIKTVSSYYKNRISRTQAKLFKWILINAYSNRSYIRYKQDSLDIYMLSNKILISYPGILLGNKSFIRSIYQGTATSILRNPIVNSILSKIYNFPEMFIEINKYLNSKNLNQCPLIWYGHNYNSGENRTTIRLGDIKNPYQKNLKKCKIKIKTNKLKAASLLRTKINNIESNKRNKLSKRHKRAIIKWIKHYGKIKHADIMNIFRITSTPASNIIKNLRNENIIKKNGHYKSTYYTLK